MARIEAFLESLEDPEIILPQLQRELAGQLDRVVNAEVKALTAVKAARRRLDEANGRLLRLKRGAELAMQHGDEDTARQAVAAQIETERKLQNLEESLAQAEIAYHDAEQTRSQLQKNLVELKARNKSLIRQYQIAREKQKFINKTAQHVDQPDNDILEAVARMTLKIDETEAQIQIENEIQKTLGRTFHEERIQELERDAEVEKRLNDLRRQIQDPPTKDQDNGPELTH